MPNNNNIINNEQIEEEERRLWKIEHETLFKVPLQIDNEKDSEDMREVKLALGRLKRSTMSAVAFAYPLVSDAEYRTNLRRKIMENEKMYIEAIEKCQTYLRHKKHAVFYSRDRYNKVKDTLKLLQEEMETLVSLRSDLAEHPEKYPCVGNTTLLGTMYVFKSRRERERSAENLKLSDFVNMITTAQRDTVIFRDGKLYNTQDAAVKSEWKTIPTHDNYAMAERLVDLLMIFQSVTTPEEQKRIRRNMLRGLGANITAQTAGPISVAKVRDLIGRFNSVTSEVDNMLLDNKGYALKKPEEQPAEYRDAHQINELLSNTFTAQNDKERKALEQKIQQQIFDILESSRHRNTYKITNLSQTSLDYIAHGRVQAVRDRVYQSMKRIRQMQNNVSADKDNSWNFKTEDLKDLIALAACEVASENDTTRQTMALQIRQFEHSQALKFNETIKTNFDALGLSDLRYVQPDVLQKYVQKHPEKWQNLNDRQREAALIAVVEIVSDAQEILILMDKALSLGLTAAEARTMRERVEDLRTSYERNSINIGELIEGFPADSKIRTAFNTIAAAQRVNIIRAAETLEREFGKVAQPQQQIDNGAQQQIDNAVQMPVIDNVPQQQAQEIQQVVQQVVNNEAKQQPKKAVEILSEMEGLKFAIADMSPKMKEFITMFFVDADPSKLIKKQGDIVSQRILRVHDAFASMVFQAENDVVTRYKSQPVTFSRDADTGIVSVQLGNEKVELPYNEKYWLNKLEMDMFVNFGKYKHSEISKRMLEVVNSDRITRNLQNSKRVLYERFLTYYFKIPAQDLDISIGDLRSVVEVACLEGCTKERLDRTLHMFKQKENGRTHVNAQNVVENLVALENRREQEKVQPQVEQQQEANIHLENNVVEKNQKEQAVLNVISAMFFDRKTKLAPQNDGTYTVERLTEAIEHNMQDFITLMNLNPLDRSKLLAPLQKGLGKEFGSAVNAVWTLISDIIVTGKAGREKEWLVFEKGEATREKLHAALQDAEVKEKLVKAAGSMKQAVADISRYVQGELQNCVNGLDSKEEDTWGGRKQTSDYTLEELIQKGMTGDEGEGAFNKKVLSGYVENISKTEQQKMVAFAFKNMPKLDPDADIADPAVMKSFMGKFMAGYIKGAGPLLHKMMQGLPISAVSEDMEEMVSDVRSNLTQIDEDIVDARLQSIIDDSDGVIERIEKLRVLGAASVGQTILVKIYEKGKTEGVEKVVKILKPDVKNAMEREIAFMEQCAREVDLEAYRKKNNGANPEDPANYVGGMLKTFRGKKESILRELDLRFEADNVEIGKMYIDPLQHIRSMQLDPNVKSSINAIVLEKAEGITIDKFIKNTSNERAEIERYVTAPNDNEKKNQDPDIVYQSVKKLDDMRSQLIKKQKYVNALINKWMQEALFGSGYFHGDLHAGNIMIDDDGVTVIDYGNVGKLTESDQKDILNMMAAAMNYNQSSVMKHIGNMLTGEAKQTFEAHKRELTAEVRTIIKKEEGNPIQKILATLNVLQNAGIGIPANLYNFIQCFIRVVGTMEDYNALIDDIGFSIGKTLEVSKTGAIENNPENGIMSGIREKIGQQVREKKGVNAKELQVELNRILETKDLDVSYLDTFMTPYLPVQSFSNLRNSARDFMPEIVDLLELLDHTMAASFSPKEVLNDITHMQYVGLADNDYERAARLIDSLVSTTQIFLVAINEGSLKPFFNRYAAGIERTQKELDKPDLSEKERAQLNSELADLRKKYKDGLDMVKKIDRLGRNLPKIHETLQKKLEAGTIDKKGISDAILNTRSLLRDAALMLGENQLEKDFINSLFDYHMVNGVVGADIDKPEGQAILDRKNADNEAAREKFFNAARRLHDASNPKSYIDHLKDVLLNKEKYEKLGVAMKSWFDDTELAGKELKAAYDAIAVEREKGAVGKATIDAFVDLYRGILNVRVIKQADSAYKQNLIDESNDNEKAMKSMLISNAKKVVFSLDGFGVPFAYSMYMKNHRMSEEERARLIQGKLDRKSEYMRNFYDAMRDAHFKEAADALLSSIAGYTNMLSRLDKGDVSVSGIGMKKQRERLESSMLNVLRIIANLPFGAVEGSTMKALFNNFQKEPTGENLRDILFETGKFIEKAFDETNYTREGNAEQLSEVFSSALAKVEEVGKVRDLSGIVINELVGPDGKEIALLDRLKTDEQINFIPAIQKEIDLIEQAPQIVFGIVKSKLNYEGFDMTKPVYYQGSEGQQLDMTTPEGIAYLYDGNELQVTQGGLQFKVKFDVSTKSKEKYDISIRETQFKKQMNEFDKAREAAVKKLNEESMIDVMVSAIDSMADSANKQGIELNVRELIQALQNVATISQIDSEDMGDPQTIESVRQKIDDLRNKNSAFSAQIKEKMPEVAAPQEQQIDNQPPAQPQQAAEIFNLGNVCAGLVTMLDSYIAKKDNAFGAVNEVNAKKNAAIDWQKRVIESTIEKRRLAKEVETLVANNQLPSNEQAEMYLRNMLDANVEGYFKMRGENVDGYVKQTGLYAKLTNAAENNGANALAVWSNLINDKAKSDIMIKAAVNEIASKANIPVPNVQKKNNEAPEMSRKEVEEMKVEDPRVEKLRRKKIAERRRVVNKVESMIYNGELPSNEQAAIYIQYLVAENIAERAGKPISAKEERDIEKYAAQTQLFTKLTNVAENDGLNALGVWKTIVNQKTGQRGKAIINRAANEIAVKAKAPAKDAGDIPHKKAEEMKLGNDVPQAGRNSIGGMRH